MTRRRCCGLIDNMPLCARFLPDGETNTGGVTVLVEELEAVRLKDVEGLEQSDCADRMGLSRPTFQRVLYSARLKIAQALVEGLAINIEGGNYLMKTRTFECVACKHVWQEAPCTAGGKHGYEIACPKCGGMQKVKLEDGVRHMCGGGHGHGHGCCGGNH